MIQIPSNANPVTGIIMKGSLTDFKTIITKRGHFITTSLANYHVTTTGGRVALRVGANIAMGNPPSVKFSWRFPKTIAKVVQYCRTNPLQEEIPNFIRATLFFTWLFRKTFFGFDDRFQEWAWHAGYHVRLTNGGRVRLSRRTSDSDIIAAIIPRLQETSINLSFRQTYPYYIYKSFKFKIR